MPYIDSVESIKNIIIKAGGGKICVHFLIHLYQGAK